MRDGLRYKVYAAFSETCWRQRLENGVPVESDSLDEAKRSAMRLVDDVPLVVSTGQNGPELFRVEPREAVVTKRDQQAADYAREAEGSRDCNPAADSQGRFDLIRRWGRDRLIIQNSTAKAQFLKTVEETGELASALAKNDIGSAVDAIGDIVVTLTLVAECMGVPIEECIDASWEQIKDRKGHLTPEGVFVKESE